MGKKGGRKRVAAKLGEKPFNVEDRVKHQMKLKDKELTNMYLWHVEQMEDLQAKHDQEIKVLSDNNGDSELLRKIKLKDGKIEKQQATIEKLKKKVEIGEENDKILEQAKDLIQIMLSQYYCSSRFKVWITQQALTTGCAQDNECKTLAAAFDDPKIFENVLLNPVLDLVNKSKISKK